MAFVKGFFATVCYQYDSWSASEVLMNFSYIFEGVDCWGGTNLLWFTEQLLRWACIQILVLIR